MGNLECPVLPTQAGIDVVPFLRGFAPPGRPVCRAVMRQMIIRPKKTNQLP